MKKTLKRIFAIVLAVIMILTVIPLNVFAEESTKPETSTDMGTSVEATSPFGKMLADAVSLDENSGEAKQNGGYITDITMSGNIAEVTFFSDTVCRLIAAIYDENTKEMLSYGITEVNSGSDLQLAKVTLNTAKIPDYFVAKAYLIGENNEALSEAYSTNSYSKTVSELMDKDIFDFDAEKVVNLDEATDNNFFVLKDDTKNVTGNEKTNVVISSDVDNGIYVFDNIDSQIKNLKVGDSFFLDNGNLEEIYVIKVADIKIDGQKATITAEGVDFEDVFEFMLIDESVDSSDMDVEEAEIGDDIESYEKIEEEINTESADSEDVIQTCGGGIDKTYSATHIFKLKNKKETNKNKKEDEFATGEVKKGEISLTVDIAFKAMVSKGYNEISLKIEPHFDITFSAEGTLKFCDFKLVKKPLTILNKWGAKITIQPAIKITLNGKIEFTFTLKFAVGAAYDTLNGSKSLCEPLNISDTQLKLDVTLYIGIDLDPTFVLLHKKLFNMKLKGDDGEGQIGFEAKATLTSKDTLDKNHDCYACVDGTISFKIKLDLDLTIAEGTKFEVDFTCPIVGFVIKITDFYWSIDHGEFGWGQCPYKHSVFNFGSYPQSEVTDSKTIAELEKLLPEWSKWTSYNYYSGTGDGIDGQMKPSDYMKYYDIDKNKDGNNDYRAVKFTSYRPTSTGDKNTGGTYQDDNGYNANIVYYFKYEPLQWRVLDESEGLVMCNKIIDSQAFNNYLLFQDNGDELCHFGENYGDPSKSYYPSNYGKSSIRNWLNKDFYNAAFNLAQQSIIKKNQQIDSENNYIETVTYDNKVFLLTEADVFSSISGNSYGLKNDNQRMLKGTDYAKCQGLWIDSDNGNSKWLLRTPTWDYTVMLIESNGSSDTDGFTYAISYGVCPALKISNLESIITSSVDSEEIVIEEDEPEILTTQSVAEVSNIAVSFRAGTANFSGISGNRYMLYSVKNFSDTLNIDSDNLLYINQATADNGIAEMDFYKNDGAVTVIVGDFGNGIETRKADMTNVYTAKLMVDGKLYKEIEYNEGQKSISLPEVPKKDGYTGEWESFSLTNGGTTINAVYTPATYIATLKVDGKVFKEISYTYGQKSISLPAVPEKAGYTGTWESYSLGIGGVTINAVYTPVDNAKIKSVSLGNDLELDYKASAKLNPVINADSSVKYTTEYKSSNTKVATVDNNGNVYGAKKWGKGTATIICTVTDEYGNVVTDTCNVTCGYAWWQWIIGIVLFGWIWY